MKEVRRVLFVCTGNIFRSASAEYCLRDYLKKHKIKGWKVSSAGTIARPEPVDAAVIATLDKLGIDISKHKQRKLSDKILAEQDIVVAMNTDHLKIIKEEFHYPYAILFNELATGVAEPMLDVPDVVKNFMTNIRGKEAFIGRRVREIHSKIPKAFASMQERFYLFEDFAKGKLKHRHRNGFPIVPLLETRSTIAFMSIDIPSKADGHILVIPKKRYARLEDIPSSIRKEMMESIARIGKALRTTHGGYNVLLNDGIDAGQYMFHTHFHIVPRNEGDDISIEVWKPKRYSKQDFLAMNARLKKLIAKG